MYLFIPNLSLQNLPVLHLQIKATLRQLKQGHGKGRHRRSVSPPSSKITRVSSGHLECVATGVVWVLISVSSCLRVSEEAVAGNRSPEACCLVSKEGF